MIEPGIMSRPLGLLTVKFVLRLGTHIIVVTDEADHGIMVMPWTPVIDPLKPIIYRVHIPAQVNFTVYSKYRLALGSRVRCAPPFVFAARRTPLDGIYE